MPGPHRQDWAVAAGQTGGRVDQPDTVRLSPTPAPRVLIAASAHAAICAELERVAPAEGLLVPLCALEPPATSAGRAPWQPWTLATLGALVVARVLLVPPALQLNRRTAVTVRPGADERLAAEIERQIAAHPRLRACAYLHSHPFARGSTRPSGCPPGRTAAPRPAGSAPAQAAARPHAATGCAPAQADYEGHMLPLLEHNRASGLAAAFSLIACRPASGRGWRVEGFALDARAALVSLGPAVPVSDAHPAVRAALLGPRWRRQPEAALTRRRLRRLRAAGYRTTLAELFDGWLRITVGPRHDRAAPALAVGFLPLDQAAAPGRWFVLPGARPRGPTRPQPVSEARLVEVLDALPA